MIRARIQIGDGDIVDTFDEYGLCYLSADNRFEADTKGFETTSYPEEDGEHTDAKTVMAAFDYKVKFLVRAMNADLNNANALVANFNRAIYDKSPVLDSDVRIYKTITFYNDYKRVKIVGIPKPISTPKSFWRDTQGHEADAAVVELTIRVTKPNLCDFDMRETS